MVKELNKKDRYMALYQQGDGFKNPQAVCELFDFSDELLLETAQELKFFVKKVLDRSEITSFGNPISFSEELEFWENIPQISMPTIFVHGLTRNLDNLGYFKKAPVQALKAFAAIEMFQSKGDIEAALKRPSNSPSILPFTLMSRKKNFFSMKVDAKSDLIRSPLHPYIAFKFLCTDEEWSLFNQRQQSLMQGYDVRIEDARMVGKSCEDIARDFNCAAYNVFDYIQTRPKLMEDNDTVIGVDNLNFVPFVMSGLRIGFGKSSSLRGARDSLTLVTASLASQETGLDITRGQVTKHLSRSLTPSTEAEVYFALDGALDRSLQASKVMRPFKVRVSDTQGPAVEARTLAQRPVRKGQVGHTGGYAGWGQQKPRL